MDAALHAHVEGIEQSGTRDELGAAMSGAAGKFDLHSFTYYALRGDQPTRSLVSASFPSQWVDRYFAAEHFRVDPLVPALRHGTAPFVWGTAEALRGLTDRQKQIFDEARQFGVSLGLSVPLPSQLRTCFGYVSDLPEPAFLRLLDRHAGDFCLLAQRFHGRAVKLLFDWVPDVRQVLRRVINQTTKTAESRAAREAIETAEAVLGNAAAPQGDILDALEDMARHLVHFARSVDERGIVQVVVGVLEMHGREADFLHHRRGRH